METSKAFDVIIVPTFASLLKSHGFTKSGSTFYLREEGNSALINVQKSRTNAANSVKFTVNLGVASTRILSFLGNTRNAKPSIQDCQWSERLGQLMPGSEDKWWVVEPLSHPNELALQVGTYLLEFAVPKLRSVVSDVALRNLWLTGNSPGLTRFQQLMYLGILLKSIGPVELLGSVIDQLMAVVSVTQMEVAAGNYLEKLDRIQTDPSNNH